MYISIYVAYWCLQKEYSQCTNDGNFWNKRLHYHSHSASHLYTNNTSLSHTVAPVCLTTKLPDCTQPQPMPLQSHIHYYTYNNELFCLTSLTVIMYTYTYVLNSSTHSIHIHLYYSITIVSTIHKHRSTTWNNQVRYM